MIYSYKGTKIEASTRKEAIYKIIAEGGYITVNYIAKDNYKNYIGKKVNVRGDVYLANLHLKELPITFRAVGGSFNCADNNLTSLEGCPSKVGGDFDCRFNSLAYLERCSLEVDGNFDCSHNSLKSLAGCPKKVGGSFDCSYNKLTSLGSCPTKVSKDFYCSSNKKQFTKKYVKSLCIVGRNIIV